MATRLIGTDDANPRLPALVVAATQGTTSADLAAGNILDTLATWTSPIASGITIGSGTVAAAYLRHGPLVHGWFRFVLAAGSAITGAVTINLPVTAQPPTYGPTFGTGMAVDGGVAGYPLVAVQVSTTTATIYAVTTSATYATRASLSATVPFTWAATDELSVEIKYLAA